MDRYLKPTIIGSLGSFVQWFDNTLFNVMLPLIIFNFVPKQEELTLQFTLLITYSATLFTRPFGAYIFAHFADIFGRKKILIITSFFMGFATIFLGLCPSVGVIGVAAPAFLLLFTFMHGFSSGGEWPTSSTYLYEINHKDTYARAGLISALMLAFGIFLGNSFISLFIDTKDPFFIVQVSWRLLFGMSSFLAIVTAYYRSKLRESPLWHPPKKRFRILEVVWMEKRKLLVAFGFAGCEGVLFNLFFNSLFPFTDAATNRAFDWIGTALAIVTSFFVYRLSKFLGDVKSIKFAIYSVIILAGMQLILPDFLSFGSFRLMYVIPSFLFIIPFSIKMPSMFPVQNRAICVGFSRNTSIFIFGGMIPILMKWYVKPSGLILASYIIITAVISLYCFRKIEKETKRLY